MLDSGLFSISEFAKYTRTTRDTLLHYDRIGLLSPIVRGENNYRYYSASQLSFVMYIHTSQRLGLTLEEIKDLKDRRTPELVEEVLKHQIEKIDENIDNWIRARKLLLAIGKQIRSVSDVDENELSIKHLHAEAIVLGDLNDFEGGKTWFDAFLSFYQDMSIKYPGLDLNYPVWAVLSEEKVRQGCFNKPDRFYFYNPEGFDRKPAGLYAVGYSRGDYGQTKDLYDRLLKYIDENGYEIYGNIYEEYPLNDACIADQTNYLIRISISVRPSV
jgi:DNA-binding transcriptional MerR regulator